MRVLVGWNRERRPQLGVSRRISEVGLHDADDGRRNAIEHYRATDDRTVGAEATHPERVTQDHDVLVPGNLIVLGEGSPEQWRHAKRGKEARPHARASQPLRFAPGGEVEVRVLDERHLLEDMVL